MKLKEAIKDPAFWLEDIQNEIYGEMSDYKEISQKSQNEIAEDMNVSKGYISQVLKGNFNYTLKKLIELSLAIGKVPILKFITPDSYVSNRINIERYFENINNVEKNTLKQNFDYQKMTSSNTEEIEMAGQCKITTLPSHTTFSFITDSSNIVKGVENVGYGT